MTPWSRSGAEALPRCRSTEAERLGLVTPRAGPGVCELCFNLIGAGRSRCRACSLNQSHLDLMVPITYSLGGGPLHMELAAYKRDADPLVPRAVADLTSMLERFLAVHEPCAGEGRRFDLVTTVPSGERRRDQLHPLRRMVAELVPTTAPRHQRLLRRSLTPVVPRAFDVRRFEALRELHGESVLLVDDMWTTGASAQSAAAALREAGAGRVAAVVIGRHLNRGWLDNVDRLRQLGGAFSWAGCALCAPPRLAAGAA